MDASAFTVEPLTITVTDGILNFWQLSTSDKENNFDIIIRGQAAEQMRTFAGDARGLWASVWRLALGQFSPAVDPMR